MSVPDAGLLPIANVNASPSASVPSRMTEALCPKAVFTTIALARGTSFTGVTVMNTCWSAETFVPSLAANVKLSEPETFAAGV